MTYEPAIGREGTLASARKGSGNFHVVVRGRSAHAGRDFAAGRGAVAAAARIAAALHDLNGRRDGVTVNVARIDGGAPLNQVPDLAVVRFNVRLPEPEGVAWIEREVARILETAPGEGIAAALHGGVTRPPKPFNAAQQALFAAARDTAQALGQPPLEWVSSGGRVRGQQPLRGGLPGDRHARRARRRHPQRGRARLARQLRRARRACRPCSWSAWRRARSTRRGCGRRWTR